LRNIFYTKEQWENSCILNRIVGRVQAGMAARMGGASQTFATH
jgi:hypothetical protein